MDVLNALGYVLECSVLVRHSRITGKGEMQQRECKTPTDGCLWLSAIILPSVPSAHVRPRYLQGF